MRPCHTPFYAATWRALSGDIIAFERPSTGSSTYNFNTQMIYVTKKNLTFLGLGNGVTIESNHAHVFLKMKTSKASRRNILLNVTIQGIHFRGFRYVIKLGRKHAIVKIQNCYFENSLYAVVKLCSIKGTIKGQNTFEMFDSTVRNCSLFVEIETRENLFVTIIRSSFIGTPSNSYKKGKWIRISSQENGVNYSFVVNDSTFLNMAYIINSRFQIFPIKTKQLTRNVVFQFTSCLFTNNGDRKQISVNNLNYTILRCINATFIGNVTQYGTVIYAESSHLQLINCTFKSNLARKSGGAVYLRKSVSDFIGCRFLDNTAEAADRRRTSIGFLPGVGGAIVSEYCNITSLKNCHFKGNTAPVFGGAIFHKGMGSILKLDHSHIEADEGSRATVAGTAVFSYSETRINNVVVNMTRKYVSNSALIFFGGLQGQPALRANNATFQCSPGKKIDVTTYFNHKYKKFSSLALRCTMCPVGHYTLHFGAVTMTETSRKGYHARQVQCYPCPLGGKCQNGTIRSADNFWGHTTEKNNNIKFHACPSGYCCSGKDCLTYNSCRKGREGILCGRCVKGATENLISSDCLQFRQCKNEWFYMLVIVAGICYIVFFLYVSEIGNFLAKIVNVPGVSTRKHKSNIEVDYSSINPLRTADSCEESQRDRTALSSWSYAEKYYFKGFIKTMFFFYQVKHLLTVYQKKGDSQSIVELTETKILDVFNFKTDVLFPKKSLTWCPLPYMSALGKQYIKLSLIALLIILLIIIYFSVLLCQVIYQKRKDQQHPENRNAETNSVLGMQSSDSWKRRTLCAGLNIILLGYATLTTTLLSSLNCVSLGNQVKVLFLQGDIVCYQVWQYVVIGVTIVWVIPFPVIITIATNLLEQKKISVVTFFASLLMPLPYLLRWVSFINANGVT